MDCCGHGHVVAFQPWMWRTLLARSGRCLPRRPGPRGLTEAARTAETTATELAVLRNSISVDVHSYGGKAEIISKATPSSALADVLRAGSLAVACLAVVPDWPVLGRNAEGALAAVWGLESRELYRYHLDRLAGMGELIAAAGGIDNGAPGYWLQYGRRAPYGIYFRPGRQ